MRVAGIDLSTHNVDIVTIDLDGREPPLWYRCEIEGPDSFARARRVRDAMIGRTDTFWDDVLAIGIEDPAGHHGTNHIYRIQGAVLQCLPSAVLVQQWRPSAWKKAVGLPGNCSKEAVAAWARPHAGVERLNEFTAQGGTVTWAQDAYDAYGVALATLRAIRVEAAV